MGDSGGDGRHVILRFDAEVEEFLATLAEQLQNNAEGVFFSQLDPQQQQQTPQPCPFHIQLVPAAVLQGLSNDRVAELLKDCGAKFGSLHGQILPLCTVTPAGEVALKINSSDHVAIVQHVVQALPEAPAVDGWPLKDDGLVVRIGMFKGPHISAFETWLNGELSTNSGVFPLFRCDTLELSSVGASSSEAPLEQVRLTGRPRQRRSPVVLEEGDGDGAAQRPTRDSHGKPPPSDGANGYNHGYNHGYGHGHHNGNRHHDHRDVLLGGDDDDGSDPTRNKGRVPDADRLAAASATLCKKIGGTGVIAAAMPHPQGYMTFSVLPDGPADWTEHCQKLFDMLNAMLRSVGAKRFLAALDAIANPFGGNLVQSILLGDKQSVYLDLKMIPELRIEAAQGVSGMQSTFDGLAVPLNVTPANEGAYGGTATPLICIPATQPMPMEGAVVIALHVDAQAFVALGLRPPEGCFHFFLPFVRVVGKEFFPINARGRAPYPGMARGSSGRPLPPPPMVHMHHMHAATHMGYGYLPTGMTGMGMAAPMPGPPMLPSHHHHHHQQHQHQHQHMSHPMSPHHQHQQPLHHSPTGGMPHRGIHHHHHSGGNGNGGGSMNGDWICPACHALVFSFRHDCFKCHELRPEKTAASPALIPRQPPRSTVHPEGEVREGDWLCDNCGGHNFATKLACFTCRAPRPPGYTLPPPPALGNGDDGGREHKVLPGDWTCPNCRENVFSKRSRCYRCSTPKPR